MAPSTGIILLVQVVKEKSCQKRVVCDTVMGGCMETHRDTPAPTSGVFCPSLPQLGSPLSWNN